ncbi:MAG: hypothetical protein ABEK10_01925 [Candidatus Nanosalina sp.]
MYQRLGELAAITVVLTGLALTAIGTLDTSDDGLTTYDLGIEPKEAVKHPELIEKTSSKQDKESLNIEEGQDTRDRSNL